MVSRGDAPLVAGEKCKSFIEAVGKLQSRGGPRILTENRHIKMFQEATFRSVYWRNPRSTTTMIALPLH